LVLVEMAAPELDTRQERAAAVVAAAVQLLSMCQLRTLRPAIKL
jgi:hypothetical protein